MPRRTAWPACSPGRAAEGMVELDGGVIVGTVRIVTEAAVNTAGQIAVQGGDVGKTFAENLLMSGGGRVIEQLAKDMGLAAELEKQTASMWSTCWPQPAKPGVRARRY